jgi:hypothetical protein
LTDIAEVFTASVIRAVMMEAISTTEMPVNVYETSQCNIPEGGHLHMTVYYI